MTELEAILGERIRRQGPLPFREVMRAALYHPRHGYYTNLRGFGKDGDFVTSPERHPAFGFLLGRQAVDVWEALDRPRPFRILELGAGSGALAESLVAFVRAHITPVQTDADERTLVYTIDEASRSLRSVQQARLSDPAFQWQGVDQPAHFIIANEVADALPADRVVVRRGQLRELRVGLDERGTLAWVEEEDAAGPAIQAYFAALGYLPPEGHTVDVCTGLVDWVKGVARRLERGVALVMDYAASPPRDSLSTYYRHTIGSDPLVRLGRQDISIHVDLRTLMRCAVAEGLLAGVTTQRRLLLNLGFQQVVAGLRGPTDRQALAGLVEASGLGGQISAALLVRGLPGYTPVGTMGRADWPDLQDIPSLPPDEDEAEFISQWHEAFGGG
ncbi:MAG: class I SAM-dependent methyltransferase [Chloroflexota bacterium]